MASDADHLLLIRHCYRDLIRLIDAFGETRAREPANIPPPKRLQWCWRQIHLHSQLEEIWLVINA